ncbi:ATP-grasp domain-containing protein [Saccharothrix violaceirubra]|uniref:ATP-grasp domain-containing protein n=1 Tax=Saccharothrix violaceirubra TaxID=413306 RepID=A0A7W7T235_9PSEU|nr:ATP-grasp domain-containing protein [Saccharothrix violaceirubra]MBB4965167.1 hypothetical protein [Saccharothrix violaceirubra]
MSIVLLEFLSFGLGRLAEAAEALDEELVLFTAHRPLYAHELATVPPDRVRVVDIDTTDTAKCEAAARDLPDLRGLISSTDTWAAPGADLAARLGLPGPDPAAVRVLRDKAAVRARLYEHGLSRGVAVPPHEAASLGFPLVVKDSAGTSSRAVWVVRDDAELAEVLARAADVPLKGDLLAEPYFAGPLYSAETITWEGRTRLLGVTSRHLSPEPLRREENSSFPVVLPQDEHGALVDWISRVLAAAGHGRGFAHTEFVWTVDGPEVVEINARIGGALVGEALCTALATNVYTALVEVALGREPDLLTAPLGTGPAVAFQALYPTTTGVLDGWTGLDRLAGLPGSPRWFPTTTPGAVVEHLEDQRGCTGIVLVEGPTAELALHRAAAAGNVIGHTVRAG